MSTKKFRKVVFAFRNVYQQMLLLQYECRRPPRQVINISVITDKYHIKAYLPPATAFKFQYRLKMCIKDIEYRRTLLYSRDRYSKNRLEYNKFAYKKTKDYCKLKYRFLKKAISGSHLCKIADKKTARGQLYISYVIQVATNFWRIPHCNPFAKRLPCFNVSKVS